MNGGLVVWVFLLGTIFGAWAMFCCLASGSQENQVVINHGCAHYDTNSGKFTWNNQ